MTPVPPSRAVAHLARLEHDHILRRVWSVEEEVCKRATADTGSDDRDVCSLREGLSRAMPDQRRAPPTLQPEGQAWIRVRVARGRRARSAVRDRGGHSGTLGLFRLGGRGGRRCDGRGCAAPHIKVSVRSAFINEKAGFRLVGGLWR